MNSQLINRLTLGILFLFSSTVLIAQTPAWPTKPIKYVVPFAPGGVSDSVSRLIAQNLSVKLG